MEVIAIGSDHAAFELKENIREFLIESGYKVLDKGTDSHTSADYPDYGIAVGEAVAKGECDLGIVICGTGIGISISANKVTGIRAAACSDLYSARLAREHNNANILALGARIVAPEYARSIVQAWLDAKFLGGRHQQRIQKIARYESGDPQWKE
jgi:ribose 5-phosphate isomerase B